MPRLSALQLTDSKTLPAHVLLGLVILWVII